MARGDYGRTSVFTPCSVLRGGLGRVTLRGHLLWEAVSPKIIINLQIQGHAETWHALSLLTLSGKLQGGAWPLWLRGLVTLRTST